MKTQRITQLLQHPEILSVSDKACIEQEIEKYPFAQSFYALKTKWKQLFSSENIQSDVEKLSMYSLHRNTIKNFINKPIIPAVSVQEKPEIFQEKEEKYEKIETKEPEISEVLEVSEIPDYLDSFGSLMTEEILEEEEVLKENTVEIPLPEKNISENEEEILDEKSNEREAILEEELTETALSEKNISESEEEILTLPALEEKVNAIHIVENEDIEEETPKTVSREYPNIEKLGIKYLFTSHDVTSEKVSKEAEETDRPTSENIEEKETLTPENLIPKNLTSESFIPENLTPYNLTSENLTPEEDFITPSERLTFTQWLAMSNKKLQPKETVSQEEQEKIIERFIETNPKIVPDRKESKGIDLKKDDVKNIANLMTVTLAQLYVEQGKFDTAIKAFKILSLKYPEKSSYFAKEIKRIKKLKN